MFSIQVSWLPSGTQIIGRMPSGRTRRSALPPRWVWTLSTRVFGGMSSGADTEVRRGRGPREFIDTKGTAGSASARHPSKPFPEGEIFHSLGLTRSGYPR